ncbi:transcriptional regulator [Nostoc sp. 3335mG]|nr:transcriptional regulator [Nostoc sp. 3335mG]
MSLYGPSVEYGLHCLLWLVAEQPGRASSRDLAQMQGVPQAMLAKIMPRLEKAGIVQSQDGIAGGYELARPAHSITVLDVVDAIEGHRSIFECKEVRRGCALFGDTPPAWSINGVCRIHAVMLRAEKRMRAELARTTLAELIEGGRPAAFEASVIEWFSEKSAGREAARLAAIRAARRPSD